MTLVITHDEYPLLLPTRTDHRVDLVGGKGAEAPCTGVDGAQRVGGLVGGKDATWRVSYLECPGCPDEEVYTYVYTLPDSDRLTTLLQSHFFALS